MILLLLLSLSALAQAGPEATANKMYAISQKYGEHLQEHVAELKPLMTSELYENLRKAWTADPDQQDFLDFDPFSNSQIGADRITCGKASTHGDLASVPVQVLLSNRGGTTHYTLKLVRQQGRWLVSNFEFAKDFNLLKTLHGINKT